MLGVRKNLTLKTLSGNCIKTCLITNTTRYINICAFLPSEHISLILTFSWGMVTYFILNYFELPLKREILDFPNFVLKFFFGCFHLFQEWQLTFVFFLACNVGDEGGFAPNIQNNEEGI